MFYGSGNSNRGSVSTSRVERETRGRFKREGL